jgi:tRNA (uracil-5-)-methyltransferase
VALTLVFKRDWDKHVLNPKGGGKTRLPPPPNSEAWMAAASVLKNAVERDPAVQCCSVVGRWRGHRLCCGPAAVSETFYLSEQRNDVRFEQPEGGFSNPNAEVAQHTLVWLEQRCTLLSAADRSADVLELHCGFGPNSVAVAPYFRKVVSIEISRDLASAAMHNLQRNECDNAMVLRQDCASVHRALLAQGSKIPAGEGAQTAVSTEESQSVGETPERNADAHSSSAEEHMFSTLGAYFFRTVICDPPRGGLDPLTLEAIAAVDNILAIFCNADAMVENLRVLTNTHAVVALCCLDQFPFTEFLECAVQLRRRPNLKQVEDVQSRANRPTNVPPL